MLKLYMVIYIGSQVGGSAGPLPYDMDECLIRQNAMQQNVEERLAAGTDIHGNPLPKDIPHLVFKCEFRDSRPVNTYK